MVSEPYQGDVRRAFLTALNESGARYLLVGDMAWNKHSDEIRPSNTAEAWIEPSASVEDVMMIHARTYMAVRKQHPESNPDLLRVKVAEETKIHREQAPLDFETSYAQRVPWVRLGQPTFVLSGDHLVASELQSPDEQRRTQARELLQDIREKELGPSRKPERGPDFDR